MKIPTFLRKTPRPARRPDSNRNTESATPRPDPGRVPCMHFALAWLCLICTALHGEVGPTSAGALAPDRIAARIQEHRTALATVIVVDADGRRLANRPVVIEQESHQFLFGCNAFRLNPADPSPSQVAYQERFAALWNFATLPFYWGSYEPTRGEPREARLRAMSDWGRANGLLTKGHPLCWHEVTPRWAAQLPIDEVHRLQLDRITREVTAFTGQIDLWDVVNEAVVMPRFDRVRNPITTLARDLGRVPLIQQTFAAARRANPAAFLILNDYITSEEYEQLIEATLEAGVRLDAIGIQSHMHSGYRGAAWAWETCERFRRFDLPLHFTELTILSGPTRTDIRYQGPPHDDWHTTPEGEQRQADQVEEIYRVLFSHPAVEAITWWDFTDHAWLGAPAGYLRKDMSPKPAYERLLSMVKGEWWTGRQVLTTDDHGRVTFRGFLGRYSLAVDDVTTSFHLRQPGKIILTAAAGSGPAPNGHVPQ
jgi:endo-1,4-beta-xylanase